MDLTDVSYIIDMYAPGMGFAFTTSLVAFFMYMMLQLIELRSFVQSMDVFDVELTKRSTFLYAHYFGYYVFIFRIIMNLIVLVVLITVIVWLILGMTQIFVGGQSGGGGASYGGGYESAAHFRGGNLMTLGDRMQSAALSIGKHILGVLFERNFLMLFFVVNAIFLLFFLIIFVQLYDRDKILDLNQEKKTNIAKTNHNFVLLIITTIVVFALMKTTVDYALEKLDMRIGAPPQA